MIDNGRGISAEDFEKAKSFCSHFHSSKDSQKQLPAFCLHLRNTVQFWEKPCLPCLGCAMTSGGFKACDLQNPSIYRFEPFDCLRLVERGVISGVSFEPYGKFAKKIGCKTIQQHHSYMIALYPFRFRTVSSISPNCFLHHDTLHRLIFW